MLASQGRLCFVELFVCLFVWSVGWFVGWLVRSFILWLFGSFVGWLVGWLVKSIGRIQLSFIIFFPRYYKINI
jgi:hypothetical protein